MSDERGTMNAERRRLPRRAVFVFLCSSFIIPRSSFTFATPTQDEVLRSIGDNVGETVDPSKLLAVVFCVAAVVVLVALLSYRRKRVAAPKVLNHPGRLLKEVSKSVNLRPAEIKRLKLLAESEQLSSPLVLLLCPSLLAKAMKKQSSKL